ncbi:MAG: glycosyltransferase family 2 protein [Sandaracinaceae bacterium]|nr:glycosyltransferase family 2 protein [Sandaracinaceae bacterium]
MTGAGLRVGVVLIGRNEGARLVRCLESVCDGQRPVVYVDSGSTDQSVAEAQQRSALVVALDMSRPFSAARARNEGWRALLAAHPGLDAVQFIDGDCEVVPGWLEAAGAALAGDASVVAVCGYRRERHPEASVYNRVCDVEWRSGPAGDVRCFGGDVMIRASALTAVGGYDPSVIAAEDDELGVRLRAHTGGRFVRLPQDSTLHDADMHRAGQWWQRAKRCGHGYAQVHHLHGAPPERYFEQNLRRTVLWGAVAPAAALGLALPTLGLSLGLLARYPVVAARTALRTRQQGFPLGHALAWGGSVALQPFPELLGVIKFHRDRVQHAAPEIIEYKS